MASVTLPRRNHHLQFIREHRNNQLYYSDDEEMHEIINQNHFAPCKTLRTLTYDQQPSTTTNHRFRHLCSRLKRRFTLTKEYRTHSEDSTESLSECGLIRLENDQSFSSSIDDSSHDFEWPDFEKVYESIPACLINALPGLDDFSIEENAEYTFNLFHFQTDRTEQCTINRMNLFLQCKRGKTFRRNAICPKLDKSQYRGQLDIFIQQLMIEKLMRTWT